MRGATSRRLLAGAAIIAAWSAAPGPAHAQSILKRIKDQTVKRVEDRKAKLDSTVMKTTGGAVDSALAKSGRGADAVVAKAGDVANTAISATENTVKQAVVNDPVGELAGRLAKGRAVLDDVRFVAGADQLDPSAAESLKRLAAAIVATPGTYLIEVHTDALPPPGDAQSLSQRRAAAVKAQLAANGVPAERLLAVGYGATRPNAANPQANARIEVVRAQ
ncbi:MAG TPA: OmpA family protein [Gemmatimonadaceae bacterium]|nr:OmpA family protein [Gemmatimonadaceae bacterium]